MKQNWTGSPPHRPPAAPQFETVVAFGVSQNLAAGITALLAFTDYGTIYAALAIVLKNDSTSANSVDLVVDVSEGGVFPNTELTQTKTCPAGDERHVDLGEPNPHTFLRVEANNSGGGACTGTWALLGIRR